MKNQSSKLKFDSKTFEYLYNYSWWIQECYSVLKLLGSEELDKTCLSEEKSDNENKKLLIEKAKKIYSREKPKEFKNVDRKKLNRKEAEKENQPSSLFAEIKAYKELVDNGYKNIKLLPEKDVKQPDFCAEKDDEKLFIEVKRIRKTQSEEEYLRNNVYLVKCVNPDFRILLANKIHHNLCEAIEKFKNTKAKNKNNKILILDYEEGAIDTMNICSNGEINLDNIYGKFFWNDLEKSYNVTIWRRNYFPNYRPKSKLNTINKGKNKGVRYTFYKNSPRTVLKI